MKVCFYFLNSANFTLRNFRHIADLSQYLIQQSKPSHYHFLCLFSMFFAICQVRFLNIVILCSQSMFSKLRTYAAHHPVCSLHILKANLRLSGNVLGFHGNLLLCRLCQGRPPDICKYLLRFLYFQSLG